MSNATPSSPSKMSPSPPSCVDLPLFLFWCGWLGDEGMGGGRMARGGTQRESGRQSHKRGGKDEKSVIRSSKLSTRQIRSNFNLPYDQSSSKYQTLNTQNIR